MKDSALWGLFRSSFAIMAVAVAGIFLSACGTIQVPMNTQIDDLGVGNKIPLRATLVIPESLSNYKFTGKPQSFTGGARDHEFPLGAEIEQATRNAFSQVFQQLVVARERPDSKVVEVLIEPEIVDFHFRYDQLSYVGFAIAAVSKIRVKVSMSDGTVVVWTRTVESPEQRSGPWMVDFEYEKHQGKAASNALAHALKEIATEASKAAEVWKLADTVRTARGSL